MRTVMNAQQMRTADKYMTETLQIPSILLMENAALGTARAVQDAAPDPCVVHVFCGTGNNGGDGLACARVLLARGYDVYVVLVGSSGELKDDPKTNFAFFEHFPDRVLELGRIEDLYAWRVPRAAVIVDALFGTGLTRDVHGMYEDVINSMNGASAIRVSVDMPSGIETDTGRVMGTAVKADHTVTFQYPKLGQYLYPGREYCGNLHIVPIGVDSGLEHVVPNRVQVVEADDPEIVIPERKADSNKGTYGKLLLVAGSRGMAGAAVMSARAAYAAGAGLVNVGGPWAVVDVMQNAVPEATCTILPEEEGRLYSGSSQAIEEAAKGKTAIAVGPGLGSGRDLKSAIADILASHDVTRVVDADALNALDNDLKVLAHARGDVIFTPHPGEFARLLGTKLHSVLEHPLELATAFAQKCRLIVVLKGATTIIAGPQGDVTLVPLGSPGMSKGGSGDVLTGVIGGLAAQGVPAYEAAVLGVYLCAVAGMRAAARYGEYSMTPDDTVRELGDVMEECIAENMTGWADLRKPTGTETPTLKPAARRSTADSADEKPAEARSVRPSQPGTAAAAQAPGKPSAEAEPAAATAEDRPSEHASGAGSEKRAEEKSEQLDAAAVPPTSRPTLRTDTTRHRQNAAEMYSQQIPEAPAVSESAEQTPAKPEETVSAPHSRQAAKTPEAAEREHPAAQPDSAQITRRMSATDIRPPRLPRSQVETTRRNALTEPSEEAAAIHSRLSASSIGESMADEDVVSDTVTAAERRSQLNEEIRRELKNKEANAPRTRRRIG